MEQGRVVMKKMAIFISLVWFIFQSLLVLANASAPGFISMQEYNYSAQRSSLDLNSNSY